MRLIDADAAIAYIDECRPHDGGLGDIFLEFVQKWLKKVPTVNARPIVSAHWVLDRDYEYLTCSNCRRSIYTGCETTSVAKRNLENNGEINFCPNCGANMRKEKS